MARDEAPPFERGATWYGGNTIDTANLGGVEYEGREYVFGDDTSSSLGSPENTGRAVRVRCVRNASGVTLKGGRLARYAATAPYETQVDGYTYALGDRPAGVIDDYLPPAGVPANDLFYVVVAGPTRVTQLSASASVLAIGSRLVPGAGTSATNNDAGRVALQDLTGATATLGNNVQNCVGFAAAADNSTEDALVRAVVHLK